VSIASGARLTPSRLNTRVWTVAASGALALTAADVLVPGTILNFTTTNPNQPYTVQFQADWDLTTAGSGLGVLTMVFDLAPIVQPVGTWKPSNVAAGARETVGQTLSGVIATPGNHSWRMVANFGGGGAARVNAGHTGYTFTLFP
jgi:hypothetical protein